MKKALLFSSALALASLSLTSNAQNNCLSLDGSSYVSCGLSTSTQLYSSNIKTMECWVKFDSFTGDQEILSRSTVASGIELLLYNNNLSFFCMNTTTVSTSHIDYPLTNLATGVWYHIAAAWNGTKETMALYVNGVSVGTRYDVGNINNGGLSLPTGTFMIGQWASLGRPLKGKVDEVRIWSSYRSKLDIKYGMFGNFNSGAANLIAYYPFNGNTIGNVLSNITATTGLNGLFTGNSSYAPSPIAFGSNNLTFDATAKTKVTVPANDSLNISTGTVEFWMKPTAFPTTYAAALVSVRGTAGTPGTRFSIHYTATTIGMWNNSNYNTINYNFSLNTWYHVAVVSNVAANKTYFYINGVLRDSIESSFSTVTGQPLTIGATENSLGDGEWFSGSIDDVRIWGDVRTPQEIFNNMNTPLTGTEADLRANYTFNQGIASGANDGVRVALDATPNNLHGMLYNFALTANSTSNWTNSSVVILPLELSAFTAVKNGTSSVLHWTTAQEQNTQSFVIERSADGRQFTSIGTLAAARNSSTATNYTFTDAKPLSGINYYRLQEVSADNKTTYSKVVSVKFAGTDLVSISPNPATTSLNYTVSSLQDTKASVNIIATNGQRVWTSNVAVRAGNNTLSADISHLPAGNYTLQILNTPAGIASSQQFTVVK